MGLLTCVTAMFICRREPELCMQQSSILLPHTIPPHSCKSRIQILLYLFVTLISALTLNNPQLLFFLHLLICFKHSLWLSPLFKFSYISLSSHLDCCSSFYYNIPKFQHMAFVKWCCLTCRMCREISSPSSQIIPYSWISFTLPVPLYLYCPGQHFNLFIVTCFFPHLINVSFFPLPFLFFLSFFINKWFRKSSSRTSFLSIVISLNFGAKFISPVVFLLKSVGLHPFAVILVLNSRGKTDFILLISVSAALHLFWTNLWQIMAYSISYFIKDICGTVDTKSSRPVPLIL